MPSSRRRALALASQALLDDLYLLGIRPVAATTGVACCQNLEIRNDLSACHKACSYPACILPGRRPRPEGYVIRGRSGCRFYTITTANLCCIKSWVRAGWGDALKTGGRDMSGENVPNRLALSKNPTSAKGVCYDLQSINHWLLKRGYWNA